MIPSILKETIKNAIKNRDNLLIYSEPGTGKTQITEQAHDETNTPYILTHPALSDPTDYKGFPITYKDADGNQRATFIPFDDLLKMINVKVRTGVIFDDFGQAVEGVQAPAMQLIHGGRLNGYTISDEIVFFILTNRRQDMAGVKGILEPVKSRVVSSIHAETDLDDWSKYAIQKNFAFETIAFNRWKKNALLDFKPTKDMTNSPCPRTWEAVSKILLHNYPKEGELEMISGAIGEAMAIEFFAFVKMARTLPDPDLILLRPDEVKVPKEPSTLYALCGALATKATDQTFGNIVKYSNRLPSEFSVMLIVDCITHNKALVKTKPFVEWNLKHQDVLV
jgi:hypothetical protein